MKHLSRKTHENKPSWSDMEEERGKPRGKECDVLDGEGEQQAFTFIVDVGLKIKGVVAGEVAVNAVGEVAIERCIGQCVVV